jgi:hypothetical protein
MRTIPESALHFNVNATSNLDFSAPKVAEPVAERVADPGELG